MTGNFRKGNIFKTGIYVLISLMILTGGCDSQPDKQQKPEPDPPMIHPENDSTSQVHKPEKDKTQTQYGFIYDTSQVIEGTVRRNENLSEILRKYNTSHDTIARLARESKGTFDVRDLAAGKKYKVFCKETDNGLKARCFVYEPNNVDYIVFSLRDSLTVYKGKKEVTIDTASITGVIESSLYKSIIDQGGSPLLVDKMSRMYAWQVDFFHLTRGDYYKLIYEKKFVAGEYVETGKILAANFHHKGDDYIGVYFDAEGESNEVKGYYDEEGNSLEKKFLKAPLNYYRISSRYSRGRYHPVLKTYRAHLGTDYAAPRGTPIQSVGDGRVVASGYTRGNGKYVKIRHNSIYTTQYLHMSRRAVRRGQYVKQGQTIGYVGSTGLATGPHVCFRFWKNGRQVNPFSVKIPPSRPIKEEYKEAYNKVKENMLRHLRSIEAPDKSTQFSDSSSIPVTNKKPLLFKDNSYELPF